MNDWQTDSDMIFTAVSSGDFDNFEQAQRVVCLGWVPDMSVSRAGIAHALGRLERFYKARAADTTTPSQEPE